MQDMKSLIFLVVLLSKKLRSLSDTMLPQIRVLIIKDVYRKIFSICVQLLHAYSWETFKEENFVILLITANISP